MWMSQYVKTNELELDDSASDLLHCVDFYQPKT